MTNRLSYLLCSLVAAGLMWSIGVQTAHAKDYELFIDVENEDDLYELLTSEQISDDTFETLHFLLREGLDLNTATREELYNLPNLTYANVDRIIAYREEAGIVTDPSAMVAAGVLDQRKFLSIAAFLVIGRRQKQKRKFRGIIRSRTRYAHADGKAPPSVLNLTARLGREYRVSFAISTTRDRLGAVRFEPNRDALIAEAPSYQYHLPKAYGYWRGSKAQVVLGSYRTGFGQKLTFDNSGRQHPAGLYPDDEILWTADLTRRCKQAAGELLSSPCGDDADEYVTPDFTWREGLFGGAARMDKLKLGNAKAEVTVFGSSQARSIYQYELYNPTICDDPDDDDNPACGAPDVYKQVEPILDPTSRFTFKTLPDMYRETLGGGSVRIAPTENTHVGVTGYGANIKWLTGDGQLDFQEWSATPYGGNFGAVGMDAGWKGNGIDFFLEGARSFDSMPEKGGGYAVIARAIKGWRNHEIDFSMRYYDRDFANPYAHPTSQADEYDGLRARNEVGGKLQYAGEVKKRWRARADVDVWHEPAFETTNLAIYGRGDFEYTNNLHVGGWVRYDNKNLSRGGRAQCYSNATDDDFNEFGIGIDNSCAGQRMQTGFRFKVIGNRDINFVGRVQYQQLDDQRYDDKMRADMSAFGLVTWKPTKKLRVRGRLRYLFEDLSDNEYLERSIWGYADVTYRVLRAYSLRLRYDFYQRTDDRASTLDRSPSPEHWLWLDASVEF